ncbi:hypothetical protein E4U34_004516 [Claviceps purpurea]|nr:hypothetical protein E4U34_004516 [Claviceps purpurea]
MRSKTSPSRTSVVPRGVPPCSQRRKIRESRPTTGKIWKPWEGITDQGDYYPINIDDRLNEQYRIVHMLGNGTWSEVWLAIEETRKHVAIKVGVAQLDANEGKVLTEISQSLTNSNISNNKKWMIPI